MFDLLSFSIQMKWYVFDMHTYKVLAMSEFSSFSNLSSIICT